ncbi:hypothetical protein M0R45_036077 [Rubus argutus]|uniref:Uncharacterized protein n=1 Tax=Rubus argutus TaxID=59490 RepID=A0AAW1W0H9_RUBAR
MRDGSGGDKIWLGSCGGFGGEEQITIWTGLDHGAKASRRRFGLDGVGLGKGNRRLRLRRWQRSAKEGSTVRWRRVAGFLGRELWRRRR